jgi:hypothetical protein
MNPGLKARAIIKSFNFSINKRRHYPLVDKTKRAEPPQMDADTYKA